MTKPALKQISLEDILRFFSSQRVPAKCEVCGGEGFGINPSQGNEASAYGRAYFEENGSQIFAFVPALTTICNTCGNTRFHDRKIVDEWLAAHPISGD